METVFKGPGLLCLLPLCTTYCILLWGTEQAERILEQLRATAKSEPESSDFL